MYIRDFSVKRGKVREERKQKHTLNTLDVIMNDVHCLMYVFSLSLSISESDANSTKTEISF